MKNIEIFLCPVIAADQVRLMSQTTKKSMKKGLLFTLVIFLLGTSLQAQTADQILEKYFENTGGIAKWKELQSQKVSGNMSMQGMDLPFTMTSKIPNKQRMEIQVQGMQIISAYDGTEAWMVNPFATGTEPVKITGDEAKEMTERNFEDEFIDYKSKGHEVILAGTEEVDGVKCYKIQFVKNKNNDKEDVTEFHFFDAENYVPIMIVSYARSGPMKGTESKTYISDYQEINGLMIPFSTETKVDGQTVMKMSFQKVSLNESVDDTIFAFPKK